MQGKNKNVVPLIKGLKGSGDILREMYKQEHIIMVYQTSWLCKNLS